MRLSLMKAAHAVVSSAAYRKSGARMGFAIGLIVSRDCHDAITAGKGVA
jgi:hypothetical protein